MGETSDQIERHIQETRNDLGDNFSELKEKVKTAVDWRAQFEEHPGTIITLALGGGVLLSALLPALRSSRRRSSQARWNAPDLDAARPSVPWDALKGALVGVAITKFNGFIEDLLPGFKQEFTKAQTGKGSDRADLSGQPT